MSIIVKEWRPAEGCEACKQAEKMFEDALRQHMQYHSEAMRLRKEDAKTIQQLRARCEATEATLTEWENSAADVPAQWVIKKIREQALAKLQEEEK